ncbi:hypothetical protein OOJ96_04035 [Pseudomonas sp. 15FMM2]|uniref:Uncharacterized protein n=1 Tax=Pseudomonas imrae TaxID=2992837 RepID=A0ACC7P8F2_9PSED
MVSIPINQLGKVTTAAPPLERLGSALSKALLRTGNCFKQFFVTRKATSPADTSSAFSPRLSGSRLDQARQEVNHISTRGKHLAEAARLIARSGGHSSITGEQIRAALNANNSLHTAWTKGDVRAPRGNEVEQGRRAMEQDIGRFTDTLANRALGDLHKALQVKEPGKNAAQIALLSEVSTLLLKAAERPR